MTKGVKRFSEQLIGSCSFKVLNSSGKKHDKLKDFLYNFIINNNKGIVECVEEKMITFKINNEEKKGSVDIYCEKKGQQKGQIVFEIKSYGFEYSSLSDVIQAVLYATAVSPDPNITDTILVFREPSNVILSSNNTSTINGIKVPLSFEGKKLRYLILPRFNEIKELLENRLEITSDKKVPGEYCKFCDIDKNMCDVKNLKWWVR